MSSTSTYAFSPLNVPHSLGTRAYGINDNGEIIGDFIAVEYSTLPPNITLQTLSQGVFTESSSEFDARATPTSSYSSLPPPVFPEEEFDKVQIRTSINFDYAINNLGEVVQNDTFSKARYPVSVREGVIGPIIYTTRSATENRAEFVYGINDAGQIVGDNGVADIHGSGTFSPITFPGALTTTARDISNLGQIVGYYTDASGTHGFLDSNGTFVSINYPGAQSTQAYGLNDLGQVVGTYTDSGGQHHGFVDADGDLAPLDVADGASTYAYGINNAGEIVGYYTGSAGTHAFLANPQPYTGPDTLVFRVSEDAWAYHPDAQFVVKADGIRMGDVHTVTALHSAGQTQDITLTGNFVHAQHVTAEFLNDQYGGPGQDVNLYIDSVSLNGVAHSGSEAITDPFVGAQAGTSTELFRSGSATFDLNPVTLAVRVSEDAWADHPDAQFVVRVDGQQVGGVQTVTAQHSPPLSSELVTFSGNFANAHQVTVEFLNDQYGGPGQDVNLYIESIQLNETYHSGSEAIIDPSVGQAGQPAELFRNGAAIFNLDDPHNGTLLA